MAASNLTPAQKAQLAFLDTLPPRFERIHRLIEELAGLRGGDLPARQLSRLLDEFRHQAAAVSLNSLADTAGVMSQLVRRSGGLQMRIRGLREGLLGLRTLQEGAVRIASQPIEKEAEGE
jgi:hypothetical protein